jgi:hypothetical protein
MPVPILTKIKRYSPGGYGAMVERSHGAYCFVSDVEAFLRTLEPHIVNREAIARTLALIERLR